jgi:uncharacterized membrane protein YqaE (UPF0057 family)
MSSLRTRWLLLAASILMPVVAVLSQRGVFGPDNATISNRYPTLLIASGYAFAIWGLIFLGDLVFGLFQTNERRDPAITQSRPWTLGGFLLTAAWMPIFSRQLFWLSTIVIWASLACLLRAAHVVHAGDAPLARRAVTAVPLSLHAGWLSLAALLQTAQLAEAYTLVSPGGRLSFSLVLFGLATALLIGANRLMGGNVAFVAAAVWGLVGVAREQRGGALPGANVASAVAIVIAAALLADTLWLLTRSRLHRRDRPPPAQASGVS